jgi:hypothetical protein
VGIEVPVPEEVIEFNETPVACVVLSVSTSVELWKARGPVREGVTPGDNGFGMGDVPAVLEVLYRIPVTGARVRTEGIVPNGSPVEEWTVVTIGKRQMNSVGICEIAV